MDLIFCRYYGKKLINSQKYHLNFFFILYLFFFRLNYILLWIMCARLLKISSNSYFLLPPIIYFISTPNHLHISHNQPPPHQSKKQIRVLSSDAFTMRLRARWAWRGANTCSWCEREKKKIKKINFHDDDRSSCEC